MIMSIDEAIKHCEEVADRCEYEASKYDMTDAYESHMACKEGECGEKYRQLAEWLKELKNLREQQQPCEDTISREYLVEHIKACWINGRPRHSPDLSELLSWVDDVPLVQPKPKTEKCRWIRYDYRTICPQSHDIDNPYWRIPENRTSALKYCPYCGKEIEVV